MLKLAYIRKMQREYCKEITIIADIYLIKIINEIKELTTMQRMLQSCRAEQSRAEQSRAEQSRAEQSRAEQSRAEQSRADYSILLNCIYIT